MNFNERPKPSVPKEKLSDLKPGTLRKRIGVGIFAAGMAALGIKATTTPQERMFADVPNMSGTLQPEKNKEGDNVTPVKFSEAEQIPSPDTGNQ